MFKPWLNRIMVSGHNQSISAENALLVLFFLFRVTETRASRITILVETELRISVSP